MPVAPIFIVGCPRSGTTLLRNLLRAHPHLTFPGESHFIPKFYKAYGNPPDARTACQLATTILNLQWVRRWGLSLAPTDFAHYRSYAQMVVRLYEEWARQEHKPRWGDKTPQYVTDLPLLVTLFPGCKIVHIYRDGRDVALSWLRVNLGPANVFTAAMAWKYFVTAGRRAGTCLPPSTYREIRYETLLTQPQETLEQLCAFLDEPFCPDILTPNALLLPNRSRMLGKRSALNVSNAEIVSTHTGLWQHQMSATDKILFESIAGDVLTALGYETEGRIRHISKAEQLFWQMHQTFWWFLGRLNTSDKRAWLKTDLLLRWVELRARLKMT
jgi:hypothetical protein